MAYCFVGVGVSAGISVGISFGVGVGVGVREDIGYVRVLMYV